MENLTNDLITKLADNYLPRPWWKRPLSLFSIWMVLNFFYFITLGLLKHDLIFLRSSSFHIILTFLGSFFSGFFLIILYRYYELKIMWVYTMIASLVILMASAFFVESFFFKTMTYQRGLSFTTGDFSCFWHGAVSTIGTLLIFPFFFRQYFFSKPKFALIGISFHLAFLAVILNELKCPDREMYHLLFGHQTTVLGVGVLIFTLYFFQQRFSLKFSKREKY